jgi:hypothetical protein
MREICRSHGKVRYKLSWDICKENSPYEADKIMEE